MESRFWGRRAQAPEQPPQDLVIQITRAPGTIEQAFKLKQGVTEWKPEIALGKLVVRLPFNFSKTKGHGLRLIQLRANGMQIMTQGQSKIKSNEAHFRHAPAGISKLIRVGDLSQ
jgi:hypothetical protein